MQFIADNWLVWLICMILFGGHVMYNQARRMKGVLSSMRKDDSMNETTKAFSNGLGSLVVSGFLGWLNGVLLVIAILAKIFMK
jgi:hypothetical protein